MSQKFVNPWDATQAINGSVYGTPVFASGAESGTSVYTAPASKFFTPEIGAPARHVNWVLKGLGDVAIQGLQHQSMQFFGAGTWAPTCIGYARSNRGFVVGSSTTVTFTRDGNVSHGSLIMIPSVGQPKVVHDDGTHIVEFENSGAIVKFASSSTVTSTVTTGSTVPFAAATVGANSVLIATSGTAAIAFGWSSTVSLPTISTVAVPAGTFNFSSTALWGSAQVFKGATTTTGNVLFYSRGSLSNNALFSPDCVTLSKSTWTGLTGYDKIADVAYDADQSVFVAACYSSTGSALKFFTSADGAAVWALSATATGPANLQVPSGAVDGTVAFTICAGVWFIAITSNQFANYVYGTSADSGKRVVGMYSLDYGQTWYPAAIDMAAASSGATLKLVSSVDQILVKHDSDIAISGRIGYNEII